MISKSLSTSEKRAALHQEAGRLAEFCQAIYPLLVAHADDWGCLPGDVFTVKHLVDPTSPRKLQEFERALMHLHNVGLIAWYDADGKRIVHIRSFAAHQSLKGHDTDGRKRQFPPPPENLSKFEEVAQNRPKSPKSALREEKRTEENLTRSLRSDSADAEPTGEVDEDLDTEGVRGEDIRSFIADFCNLYSKHRFGAKYMVRRAKDIPLVRKLLLTYDAERLRKLSVVLFTTDDEWVAGTDRGIGILCVKVAWLDGLLAEHEAKKAARVAS